MGQYAQNIAANKIGKNLRKIWAVEEIKGGQILQFGMT